MASFRAQRAEGALATPRRRVGPPLSPALAPFVAQEKLGLGAVREGGGACETNGNEEAILGWPRRREPNPETGIRFVAELSRGLAAWLWN